MKRQYLGDARDAFKWEYQDRLARQLSYHEFQIVPMLTLDDGTNEGSIHSTQFPAASVIHEFCSMLRESRSLDDLKKLPLVTQAGYQVRLHRPETTFLDSARDEYFSELNAERDQLVFIDPDIGFEPRGRHDKHIAFADVENILNQVSRSSAVSVYQHKRRMEPFQRTFEYIRRRLRDTGCTAISNHSVMFVTFSRSRAVIERIRAINAAYATDRKLNVWEADVKPAIDVILSTLNKHKIRATYGAVAELRQTHARNVSQQLGTRRPEASWIVSKRTGLPTGYLEANCHEDLQSNPKIIDTADELELLIKSSR